jgi:hypothetical protein
MSGRSALSVRYDSFKKGATRERTETNCSARHLIIRPFGLIHGPRSMGRPQSKW